MADDATKDTTQTSSNVSNDSGNSSASSETTSSTSSTSSATSSSTASEASTSSSTATSTQASSAETPTSSAATSETASASNTASSAEQGSTAASSPLPTPEEQFPQDKYRVTVHPEILASEAFKSSRFLPPREDYNYNYNLDGSHIPDDPNYQWVVWNAKQGDAMSMFWKKYRVNTGDMQRWNPWQTAFDYDGKVWKVRILASLLPHD